jgi:hypothetical protein
MAVVDAGTGKLKRRIALIDGPNGIAMDEWGYELYVANYWTTRESTGRGGIVSVIDRERGEVITEIEVGDNPAQIAVTGNTEREWPSYCPAVRNGGNLCVEEPYVTAGGELAVNYRIVPGLPDARADVLLGARLPRGGIVTFRAGMKRKLRVQRYRGDVASVDRIVRGIRVSGYRSGTLKIRVPAGAPEGDYRIMAALMKPGTNRALQVVSSNSFVIAR